MGNAKKIIAEPSLAEISEKKSRFIALCQACSSEEQALELIAAQRKKYYDARHVCFAYCIGDNNEIQRFSDDGEPQGTAGKPILDVILSYNLKNALITVTRYFGGTLLGTGGLVRAYSLSSKLSVEEGLLSGSILETARGAVVNITLQYKDMGRLEHYCRVRGIRISSKEFSENVLYTLLAREENLKTLEADITNMTLGNAAISQGPVEDLVFS